MPIINITGNLVVQTAAQWAADATVYSAKKILITSDATYSGTDQRKFKIADGTQTWSNLDYFGEFGTIAGTWAQGNDSRFTDVRNQKIIAYQNISASHTGNTNETIVEGNLTVPANTIGSNGRLMIDAQYGATGTASTKTFRIYINSSANTLVGATLVATTQLSSSNLSGGRRNIIQNKNSQSLNEVIAPTASLTADTALTNAAAVTLDYDFATISYFIVTVQNGSAADTGTLRNIQILASNP